MDDAAHLQRLLDPLSQSCQALIDIVNACPSPATEAFTYQLHALQNLTRLLSEVPREHEARLRLLHPILQFTTRVCTNTEKAMAQIASSSFEEIDWASFQSADGNIENLT